MADDIKSLIKRIEVLEKADKDASGALKKIFVLETKLALMSQQIVALQKDGVGIENRIKTLESKK
jgi:predicted  nucleic acid-binding Zn-ribbon protein